MDNETKVESPDMGVAEFDVVKEQWNEYELSDTTRIRGRIIITRLGKTGKADTYATASQNIFTVIAPMSKRGQPGTALAPEEISVTEEKIQSGLLIPVDVITASEPWNVYRIKDAGNLLQVKMLVSGVFRVKDRYDVYGEPAYVITSTNAIGPAMKANYRLG